MRSCTAKMRSQDDAKGTPRSSRRRGRAPRLSEPWRASLRDPGLGSNKVVAPGASFLRADCCFFLLGRQRAEPTLHVWAPWRYGLELLVTVRADARGKLGLAFVLEAVEPAASAPGALGQVRDDAVEHLVDEELHVGATLRHAVGDARHAEHGRVRLDVDALEGAADDLEARLRRARAAVLRADRAGLEVLALPVRAHRAHAAVLLAGRARLVVVAEAVAAADAFAAVGGAGRAVLRLRVADAVAAGLAGAAVGRAGEAVLGRLAEAVAAEVAHAAVAGAARAGLAVVALLVAARGAEAAVGRAARAGLLAGVAGAVAAGRALAAVLDAGAAVLAAVAGAVAAGCAGAAVDRAAPQVSPLPQVPSPQPAQAPQSGAQLVQDSPALHTPSPHGLLPPRHRSHRGRCSRRRRFHPRRWSARRQSPRARDQASARA